MAMVTALHGAWCGHGTSLCPSLAGQRLQGSHARGGPAQPDRPPRHRKGGGCALATLKPSECHEWKSICRGAGEGHGLWQSAMQASDDGRHSCQPEVACHVAL
ncbi:hypothetical protein NDU88_006245 [Pleurodeles waltl]|uniref:Uncharacterized protein n=1 Tax=Pleurodeles waltl TaxID=8319 RepID=A0AAV7L339_PLEWA|nr:hypothetical protein NDU88_006245 [Pleurodeles waltl]